MAATTEMNDGSRFLQLFGQKEEAGETIEQFTERKIKHAQEKLRNPKVNKYYQIKVGRNDPCPCGSGKKFKKCCWGKINQPEFQIASEQQLFENLICWGGVKTRQRIPDCK